MIFWAETGPEAVGASATSYYNRVEAVAVENYMTHFLKDGIGEEEIGVTTTYEGQPAYVVSYVSRIGSIRKDFYHDVEVASVDGFQRREKKQIMYCVR